MLWLDLFWAQLTPFWYFGPKPEIVKPSYTWVFVLPKKFSWKVAAAIVLFGTWGQPCRAPPWGSSSWSPQRRSKDAKERSRKGLAPTGNLASAVVSLLWTSYWHIWKTGQNGTNLRQWQRDRPTAGEVRSSCWKWIVEVVWEGNRGRREEVWSGPCLLGFGCFGWCGGATQVDCSTQVAKWLRDWSPQPTV